MVHRTSTGDREALAQLREEALGALPWSPRAAARHLAHSRQSKRGRKRRMLARLLVAAAFLAYITGSTSYRMHMAMRWHDRGGEGSQGAAAGEGGASRGLLAGIGSWLAGSRSRRSLREGMPGEVGAAGGAAGLSPSDADAGAVSLQMFDQWWLLGGDSVLPPHPPEQQAAAAGSGADSDGGSGGGGGSPLQRLLRLRRLHPGAVRLYDFRQQSWLAHNLTTFPQEVPLARWGVATLLNRAKKKESAILLAGGYMSQAAEVASRPRRPPHRGGAAGAAAARAAVAAAAAAASGCPLAAATVFTINPGRTKVRALPPLPTGSYGATAVVAGARLHVFGGWATPDRATRLAVPAAEHWSLGLNADGTSAPEWQQEASLPAALRGRTLTAVALAQEENGEPAIFVWPSDGSGSGGSGDGLSAGERACRAAPEPEDGGEPGGEADGQPLRLWAFAGSTGWRRGGPLPAPLAADLQCAVGATRHQLLAVGSVERSGLLSWRRGVWEYDARDGGSWSRAGWAPPDFAGQLCAIHHGRLFVSRALPPRPTALDAGTAPDWAGDADLSAASAQAEAGAEGRAGAEGQPATESAATAVA